MRLYSVLLSSVSLGACLYFGLNRARSEPNAPPPNFDIFDISYDHRVLTPHSKPDPNLDAIESSNIAKTYYAIRPERSIFAYDCEAGSAWCSDSTFGIDQIFKEAARVAPGGITSDALALSWYDSSVTLDAGLQNTLARTEPLSEAFQLLAVANRMDLAQNRDGLLVGAEIHFVYGLIPAPGAPKPPNLTVILEFVLKNYDPPGFRELAKAWAGLSTATDIEYAGALKSALIASGFMFENAGKSPMRLVRSRMNHEINGLWQFTQLVLDPNATSHAAQNSFSAGNLDDQMPPHPDPQQYLEFWKKVEAQVASGELNYEIPPGLLLRQPTLQYNARENQGMDVAPGVCKSSVVVRKLLALQQCRWCHTTETGTNFLQVQNRFPKDRSVLSGFLAGANPQQATDPHPCVTGSKPTPQTNLHPCLADLYYGETSVVSSALVQYNAYQGATCQTAVQAPASVLKFHDIARRTLRLAEVINEVNGPHGLTPDSKFSTFFTE